MTDKGVVLLSGGMDSAAVLAMAGKVHDTMYALSFDYGQKHTAELDSATAVAEHYGAQHRIVSLPRFVFQGSGSALIEGDHEDMPQMSYEEIEDAQGPSPTYVPYRNGTFISTATAYALSVGASAVWAGMHAEDGHNFAYPDCTPEFIGAQAAAMYVGSYHEVRLITPLEWMTKADVASYAVEHSVPLDLTMSCYEGTRPACGTCPTCVGRLQAFENIGVDDPLEYA